MTEKCKITQEQLIAKVKDLEVSDKELAAYFIVDEHHSDAFRPLITANPDMVEDKGLEGAFLLNSFNSLARWRRNAIYRLRIRSWNGIRVVAEGDSWLQYPLLLKDTIDHLVDLEQFRYAVYGLSEAGDLMSSIIKEDEITEAVRRENPHVLLISGGGNDMVGNERMATLVHKYSPNRLPQNYPNDQFKAFLDELGNLYHGLFHRLLAEHPHLKILCHGYDNAIPNNGKWLGKPLQKQNITDTSVQQKIVAEMIKRFNQRLQEVAAEFAGSVFHVDCRNVIGKQPSWHDELHPKDDGYLKVASKFDETIQQALAGDTVSPPLGRPSPQPGIGRKQDQSKIRIARLQKLPNKDFANLVASRAETLLGRKMARPGTQTQRKAIEQDINIFFEKVHKEANFLPSSFLEKGVRRAQAVCRISTNISYGSGFLIASRHFIMTNNHIIPSKEVARVSKAEFDYDEDGVLYTLWFNPDSFFITDKELDFTIVGCDPGPLPANIEAVPLVRDSDTVTRGERVNIIQHPQGRPKEISIHDNKVNYIYDIGIRYTADTEGGSSGSPVFNNEWNLVALHHAGWSSLDGSATNEGIRLFSIVEFLRNRHRSESSDALDTLLAHITEADAPAAKVKTVSDTSAPSMISSAGKQVTLNFHGNISRLTLKVE